MQLSEATDPVDYFREKRFRYQMTFETPLGDLPRFVGTLLSPFDLEKGEVNIALVVFKPEDLLALLARHSLSPESVPAKYFMHVAIKADDQAEIASMLEAAFGDWVDFSFIATPEHFAIFADHDEYTTFFSQQEADLSRLASALLDNGFAPVSGYLREF